MTNKNTNLNDKESLSAIEEDIKSPFLLSPAGKDYLWGGNRLNDDFSKNLDMSPLAETWECSTHEDGLSYIAQGKFEGRTLQEVLIRYPEMMGKHPRSIEGLKAGELPILIKLIDAKADLSLQVHPTDQYAKEHENGQLGKTEMWYVLDASKNAGLIYGFKADMTKQRVKKSLENGTILKYVQTCSIKKDDVFLIEAGMVHAINAGALVAEIQENSNLTYRLYDYDRKDKYGNLRPLHIEKALETMNYKGSTQPRQPMRVLKYHRGYALELLCSCKYFQVERLLLNTERCRTLAGFCTDSTSFVVLLCTKGCGMIIDEDNGQTFPFFKGDCIFVPALSHTVKLHGKAEFLKVKC